MGKFHLSHTVQHLNQSEYLDRNVRRHYRNHRGDKWPIIVLLGFSSWRLCKRRLCLYKSWGCPRTHPFGIGTDSTSQRSWSAYLIVNPPTPNLLVDQVTPDKTTYTTGETMKIRSMVRNSSTVDITTPFFVAVSPSGPGSAPSCSTIFWTGYDINNLAGGSTDIHVSTISAPGTPGTYQVGVYADTNPCQITETNESDNYLASTSYTVISPALPGVSNQQRNPGVIWGSWGGGGWVETCVAAQVDLPWTNIDNAKLEDGQHAFATTGLNPDACARDR